MVRNPLAPSVLALSGALLLALAPAMPARAADDDAPKAKLNAGVLSGLKFRAIGPGTYSGRIGDIAVHPNDPDTWYIAVAMGNVWKTTNHGITFEPIFDGEGSYSIGCVTIDPNDPLTVWVGTGENNSQRSVGYGDGVYKSTDGGKSWENMGLKDSGHIGMIKVDPRNSNVVWVAAFGPLWSAGGDRGLFKTTDGGKSWTKSLDIDEHTGVNEVHLDPRNPDVVLATSYQRGRRVWTLINGGPGSGLHRSTDGGATWKKITTGLPKEELGRLGLAQSQRNPDLVYALVEAANGAGGTFRSTDGGRTWEKRSGYSPGGAQYYQELFIDPNDDERVYSMDVFLQVTDDGGKNWRNAGERYKHVDNHAMWIDPADSDHLLIGCDGGLYESYDRGATWMFFPNLPITQLYKIAVDNAQPFYNVYGGTQDNYSFRGPSRTTNLHGIRNDDWTVTQGGDGFQSAVDPTDPNIVYAQAQHGELTRYDHRSGEGVDIQPQPGPNDPPLRWNWDSPLIISPHAPSRLYFAANRLFRSDDRGDSWRPLGGDLTRQLNRDSLEIMGRTWSIDAVARHASTSQYGNIVALSESPLVEGLLYVGCDDGLIQVSENGGDSWRRVDRVSGVPELTYVSDMAASRHDPDRVYATFNNMKMGDQKPYVFRSDDRGRSWRPIAGDLPERGGAWSIVEDPVSPDLLFCGTEFGAFVTVDGGAKWLKLKSGVPTISVRDIAVQEREGDVVLGTFGRGFYVLDDYTPLRHLSEERLVAAAAATGVTDGPLAGGGLTFPVRPAPLYFPSAPLGLREKAFQGEMYFTAPNPPFGAMITWYRAEDLKTRKKKRQEREKELAKAGAVIPRPSWDELRLESREEEPYTLLTITDADGAVVRRLKGPAGSGIQRLTWDLTWPPSNPVNLSSGGGNPDNLFSSTPAGPVVPPGTYRVSFSTVADGVETPFGTPQTIETRPLGLATIQATDVAAVTEFRRKTARLQRAALGANQAADEAQRRIDHLQKGLLETPGADPALLRSARDLDERLKNLRMTLNGDPVKAQKNMERLPSILQRINRIIGGQWTNSAPPTRTFEDSYAAASEQFGRFLADLRTLVETDLVALERRAEAAGVPWTPGRVPTWTAE
jgi:photosystem II stability/assembly factor-like uncharacterized protein